ncbi:hypothetical protein Celaphus_00002626 [Cervus elaphus hippelaphus]|uniref:DNA methyltransferase 1-associated protein 1 n=1 Tax=Cervus elaphus hippelaphus TaxID=46360 RepID=A0A212CHM7_CEREH|nr:hypothetical protein Celaphus_00002626 [Cervus elaphus hippelaphus]
MATGADVRDILELGGPEGDAASGTISKKDIINPDKKKSKKSSETLTFKRPEGMHREVYALLYSDKKQFPPHPGLLLAWDAPPLLPSDTGQGYRTVKAKLGSKKVRPWKWMPFTNPARKDGAMFFHWRRAAEEGKDYPFARFNKTVQVPVYSEQEYQLYLHDDAWTKAETDHLFDLSRRFDLRFVVIHDRYDHQQFKKRSVEDLKERYYHICAKLANVRAVPGTDLKIPVFDAGHERRRKEQLERLYNRTPEQELQMLRHRHEALARAGVLGGPTTPASGPAPAPAEPAGSEPGLGSDLSKDAIIDVVGAPLTPNSRKRRESASSSSSVKKAKKP